MGIFLLLFWVSMIKGQCVPCDSPQGRPTDAPNLSIAPFIDFGECQLTTICGSRDGTYYDIINERCKTYTNDPVCDVEDGWKKFETFADGERACQIEPQFKKIYCTKSFQWEPCVDPKIETSQSCHAGSKIFDTEDTDDHDSDDDDDDQDNDNDNDNKIGTTGRFPYVWLRDNCPAEHTYLISPSSKSRKLLFKDLDTNVQPEQANLMDDGVQIMWPGSKDSFYSSKWLQDRNLSNPQLRERRKAAWLNGDKITWNRQSIMKKLGPINWNDMWRDDRVFYEVLSQLNTYGIVLLDNVPAQKGEELKLAKELGYHKPTNYGETFNVVAMATPTSLAYTSIELGFHCDLPHMNQIPDVQGLHCIRATEATDGVTIFVDSFEAAKQMKKNYPEQFKMLCTVPVEFVDDMIYEDGKQYIQFGRHCTLNLDDDGNLKYTAWSNLLRSWFYDLPAEDMQKMYVAMDIFHKYLVDPENFIGFRFEPGQFIIFDNLRVLHGRTAFTVNERTDRFLEGVYYSWDAVKSKIRCLHRKLNLEPELVTI